MKLSRKMFKKSISFNKKKMIGEIIKKDDLDFTKIVKIFLQFFSHKIVGKKVLKEIKKNEPLDSKKLTLKLVQL